MVWNDGKWLTAKAVRILDMYSMMAPSNGQKICMNSEALIFVPAGGRAPSEIEIGTF